MIVTDSLCAFSYLSIMKSDWDLLLNPIELSLSIFLAKLYPESYLLSIITKWPLGETLANDCKPIRPVHMALKTETGNSHLDENHTTITQWETCVAWRYIVQCRIIPKWITDVYLFYDWHFTYWLPLLAMYKCRRSTMCHKGTAFVYLFDCRRWSLELKQRFPVKCAVHTHTHTHTHIYIYI